MTSTRADVDADLPSRRDALRFMGTSLALAGLSACTRQPLERIVPSARTPESTVPGRPRWFATSMPWPSGALGLLVESHMGRPTKIEGNPDHPASLGSADAIAQAQVLGLYDVDRSQVVRRRGRIATWDALAAELRTAMAAQGPRRGAGLRILTETVTSPTLAAQLHGLLRAFPEAAWHQYEPVNRDRERAGALQAFGRDASVLPRLDVADVVVALDADFLGGGPASVRLARDFASRRRVRAGATSLNRLYVVEASPSLTGAMADHRVARKPSQIAAFALQLDAALEGVLAGAGDGARDVDPFVRAMARDLASRRGAALLLAGSRMPAEVHALAHRWNERLGNVGRTLTRLPPVEIEPVDQQESLARLVADMEAGKVEMLVILGGNPAWSAPSDVPFAGALARVPLRVRLGLYEDETSRLCDWHVPESHFLESWSDALAADGTAGVVQPLIAPLWSGRSSHEVVATLAGEPAPSGYERVRAFWRERLEGDFEARWRKALRDGRFEGTAAAPLELVAKSQERQGGPASEREHELELELRPDPHVFDGRFANNAWLQELPRPLTKLTWDNAAFLSATTASRLGVESGSRVELALGERSLEAPVWILPGQADGCVTLSLGFGRLLGGRHAIGVGFDVAPLHSSRSSPLRARVLPGRHEFATTQEHDRMEGRDLARAATIEEFADPARLARLAKEHAPPASLYPPHPPGEHAWGMVIDLGVCTGCSACVVACQSENNIPSVGKLEVARGRALHWIRVDRYFEGDPLRPRVRHQPVPCMHCENAPCEVVCPVGATVHSPEGLNEQVYNRCVGTRYCGNNCPYKVRRFNFVQYADWKDELLAMQRNPDVTVRSRGVMEKCTYCIQRINEAKSVATRERRGLRDGDVVPACQQTCPAQAIVFGDLQDPESRVAKLQHEPHRYALLEELGTRPRTTYLARVENPDPGLPA